MEALLHSVLLREKQLEMQWEAEFEQQKQLLHMNTATFFDMLPIRPYNKRRKVTGGLQFVQTPSCYDKENLVGSLKMCLGTRGPYSRGTADKSPTKDIAQMATARPGYPYHVGTPRQSGLPNCLDSQTLQQNTRCERAIDFSTQTPLGVLVDATIDEGAGCKLHGPAPDKSTVLLAEGKRKITHRGKENPVMRKFEQENREVLEEPKLDVDDRAHKAVAETVGEKSRGSMAGMKGEAEVVVMEVEGKEQSCGSLQVAEPIVPKVGTLVSTRRALPKRAAAVATSATALPQISQRVTRSKARKLDTVIKSEIPTTSEQMPTDLPTRKKPVRQGKKPAELGIGVTNSERKERKPREECEAEGADIARSQNSGEGELMSRDAMHTHVSLEESSQTLSGFPAVRLSGAACESRGAVLSGQVIADDFLSKTTCRHSKGSAAVFPSQLKDSDEGEAEQRSPGDGLVTGPISAGKTTQIGQGDETLNRQSFQTAEHEIVNHQGLDIPKVVRPSEPAECSGSFLPLELSRNRSLQKQVTRRRLKRIGIFLTEHAEGSGPRMASDEPENTGHSEESEARGVSVSKGRQASNRNAIGSHEAIASGEGADGRHQGLTLGQHLSATNDQDMCAPSNQISSEEQGLKRASWVKERTSPVSSAHAKECEERVTALEARPLSVKTPMVVSSSEVKEAVEKAAPNMSQRRETLKEVRITEAEVALANSSAPSRTEAVEQSSAPTLVCNDIPAEDMEVREALNPVMLGGRSLPAQSLEYGPATSELLNDTRFNKLPASRGRTSFMITLPGLTEHNERLACSETQLMPTGNGRRRSGSPDLTSAGTNDRAEPSVANLIMLASKQQGVEEPDTAKAGDIQAVTVSPAVVEGPSPVEGETLPSVQDVVTTTTSEYSSVREMRKSRQSIGATAFLVSSPGIEESDAVPSKSSIQGRLIDDEAREKSRSEALFRSPVSSSMKTSRPRKRGTTIRHVTADLQISEERMGADAAPATLPDNSVGGRDQQATQACPVLRSSGEAVHVERKYGATPGSGKLKRMRPTLEMEHIEPELQLSIQCEEVVSAPAKVVKMTTTSGETCVRDKDSNPHMTDTVSGSDGGCVDVEFVHGGEKVSPSEFSDRDGKRSNNFSLGASTSHAVSRDTVISYLKSGDSDCGLPFHVETQAATLTETQKVVSEVGEVAQETENGVHSHARHVCDTESLKEQDADVIPTEAVLLSEAVPCEMGLNTVSVREDDGHRVNQVASGKPSVLDSLDSSLVYRILLHPSHTRIAPQPLDINECNEEYVTPFTQCKPPEVRDMFQAGPRVVSLEQEFHPDVTLTLDRWQFKKKLSRRSKARARRWRSDVAMRGGDHEQGQAADVLVTSPDRAVPSIKNSMEVAEYETFLQTPLDGAPLQQARQASVSSIGKAVNQEDIIFQQNDLIQPGRSMRQSGETHSNEVLSQAFEDGEDIGIINDGSMFMHTAHEQDKSSSPMPLLQSIYTLSKACQNGMVSAGASLEEADRKQVQSLITSANQIIQQLSSKKVQPIGAAFKTPAPSHSSLYTSAFSNFDSNVYPTRSNLFSHGEPGPSAGSPEHPNVLGSYPITPSSSPAAIPSFEVAPELPTPGATCPVPTMQEVVGPDIPSGIGTSSASTKHPNELSRRQAGSLLPETCSALPVSVTKAEPGASLARLKSACTGQFSFSSGTCNNGLVQEIVATLPIPPAVGSVWMISSPTASDQFGPAPVAVNPESPKTGRLHSISAPVYSSSVACRPADSRLACPPVVSNTIAPTPSPGDVKYLAVPVSEGQDDGDLQRCGVGSQSNGGLIWKMSTEELAGGPLGEKINCKEDISSRLWARHDVFVEEAEVLTSAVANKDPDLLTAKTGPVRSSSHSPSFSAECGPKQQEGAKVSAVGSSVFIEEFNTRAGDDDCWVEVLRTSPACLPPDCMGQFPPHHGGNAGTEVAAVKVMDERQIQMDAEAATEVSQLTSSTTNQTAYAGAAVVAPLQQPSSRTSAQLQNLSFSQSAVKPGLASRVPSPPESLKFTGPKLSEKAGEEELGPQALDSGVHGLPLHRSSLEVPVAHMERQSKIQGPPRPIHHHPGLGHGHPETTDVREAAAQRHPVSPGATTAARAQLREGVHLEESAMLSGLPKFSKEPCSPAQSQKSTTPASSLRVEPQRPSNLVGARSDSTVPRSNLVSSMRSFIPLVQQQQPAAPYPNGKRDVKVKALEAAEAARRQAEQREVEKQERKRAIELAKREKLERAAQEKLKEQQARAGGETEEPNKTAGETMEKKAVAAGAMKTLLADSSNNQGRSNQTVLLKVKRAMELKSKMEQDKQERLQEEQRRKEEEWKRKEADVAARKRKREAVEKKEREEKRKRQEEAMKAHREMEERQRAELEEKAQKRRALEESERERKVMDEEMKRQKRIEKEKDMERRRKEELDAKAAWLDAKEATRKRKEEAARQMKEFEDEGRHQAVKMARTSGNVAMSGSGPFVSYMSSLRLATSIGEGAGAAPHSGVNHQMERHRSTSQSLLKPPLRVPQTTAEGMGAAVLPGCNPQAERTRSTSQGLWGGALRVLRTTPEGGAPSGFIPKAGSGQSLLHTPPEAVGNTVLAASALGRVSGVIATASALRERINIFHSQTGANVGGSVVAGGNKGPRLVQAAISGPPGGVVVQGESGVQSYEISPFRDSSDEDSEDEQKRPQKQIPQWARKENLMAQLVRQLEQDPDDIFAGATSCSLDEVFQTLGSKRRPDFKRRGSSGDWVHDHVTWQEEIRYKTVMGYLH